MYSHYLKLPRKGTRFTFVNVNLVNVLCFADEIEIEPLDDRRLQAMASPTILNYEDRSRRAAGAIACARTVAQDQVPNVGKTLMPHDKITLYLNAK